MGSIRFAGQEIQSWSPVSDDRAAEDGKTRILAGRNYLFDANGPKSGFGHRLVTGGRLGTSSDIQSIDVDNQSLIAASDGIYRQEYAIPALRDVLEPSTWWRKLTSFTDEITDDFNSYRWYNAFLNGTVYICQKYRGLFRVSRTSADLHDVDGVPANPIAVATFAGRLIVLNPFVLTWSGPGDGFDFQPELGGAGLQLTNQYMSGEPIGMTYTDKELIVWGSDSAMLVEYIGGEKVLRFSALNMGLYPISPMCITQYMQTTSFIMTKHGIAAVDGTQLNINVTPEFNQFIRSFLNDNYLLKMRLDYIKEDDMLYVSFSDSQAYYYQTYCLSVTLDKWGSFDEQHLGLCRFGAERGVTGFADIAGYLHKFTDTPDKEIRGKGLVGLDSYIDIGYLNTPEMIQQADTTLEIQELKISSRKTFPTDFADLHKIDLQGDGLYWNITYGDFIHSDWGSIELLYRWNEDMNFDYEDNMDLEYEIPVINDTDNDEMELLVLDDTTNNEAENLIIALSDDLNNEAENLVIDDTFNNAGEDPYPMGQDYNFQFWPNEDWNQSLLLSQAEDYNLLPIEDSEDHLLPPMESVWTPSPGEYEDLMVPSGDEDRHGPFSFYGDITNKLRIYSSFVGNDYDLYFDPELAIKRENRDLYTTLTAGRFQFFRISAVDRWDYFHVTQFDASISYQGQYS